MLQFEILGESKDKQKIIVIISVREGEDIQQSFFKKISELGWDQYEYRIVNIKSI